MNSKLILLCAITFSLVGCAGNKSMGDTMINRSIEAKELSAQWNDGAKLIAKGEAMEAKGKKLIDEGQSMVSAGRDKVSQGTKLKTATETDYNTKFPSKS
jgi:hypothetical protein